MFERDESKALDNKPKHGISFADTFAVFEDPNAVTIEGFRNHAPRVIKSNGSYGEFGGGSEMNKKLIELNNASSASSKQVVFKPQIK